MGLIYVGMSVLYALFISKPCANLNAGWKERIVCRSNSARDSELARWGARHLISKAREQGAVGNSFSHSLLPPLDAQSS